MNGVSLEIPVADENHREEIEKIHVNRRISAAVDANFRPGTFRSSVVLKDALKAIVESHVVPHLRQCYGQASFNTRVGALMKLSVSFLCMPRLSTLLGFGLMPSENEGYEITKSLKACVTEMLSILLDSERFKLNAGRNYRTLLYSLFLSVVHLFFYVFISLGFSVTFFIYRYPLLT